MAKSSKGSQFERIICKDLSLWWTNGKRDDVFWRSAQSGGRATQRAKSKKKTFGQYGDITATDPIGQPLTNICCIELKRGYSQINIHDLVDRLPRAKSGLFESFINQAISSWKQSGSFSWLLIIKRNSKNPFVVMPAKLYKELRTYEYLTKQKAPFMSLKFPLKRKDMKDVVTSVYVMTYEDFKTQVEPRAIIAINDFSALRENKKKKAKAEKRTKSRKLRC